MIAPALISISTAAAARAHCQASLKAVIPQRLQGPNLAKFIKACILEHKKLAIAHGTAIVLPDCQVSSGETMSLAD